MICEETAKKYCCEDLSNIENYETAINDTTQTWHCHHRGEILPCGRFSADDLNKFGLYFNRPAAELIFLTPAKHKRLHTTGNNLSDETKKKMSDAKKNMSDETKKKISEAMKNRHHRDEKAFSKKVLQYDLNGNLIAEFKSQREAAASIGLKSQGTLCIAMKNGIPYRNFIWKFA